MQLYPWQSEALDSFQKWYEHGDSQRYLIAAPTGSGKSIVELEILKRVPGSWLLTPRIEIIRGMLDKLGYLTAYDMGIDALMLIAERHHITTPIRMRNRILSGEFQQLVTLLIWDECHHHEAETWKQVSISQDCKEIGFTATPYRGTPKSTAAFRESWGEPHWLVTYSQAIKNQLIRLPVFKTVPLVDDDVVTVTNGEFAVERLESETIDRMQDALQLFAPTIDMPTVVWLPGTRSLRDLEARLGSKGIQTVSVTQDTSDADRREAFADCLACRAYLLQISVVSEGVDLHFKRAIDLRATMSPVNWLQFAGRIMRPGGQQPEYVCTNRNLMRHGYLLDGMMPKATIVEAQNAFPLANLKAIGSRAVGLESIGRFKPESLRFSDGCIGAIYALRLMDNGRYNEYCCILHPSVPEPFWAVKSSDLTQATPVWGKWKRCNPPTDLAGFASQPASKLLSPKQVAWWQRSAGYHGIDPSSRPTPKSFQALPVLADTQMRIV